MVYEVREWRWIRTRSVARNQVSLSFPPTHPLEPGAATSLPAPARPRLAGPRLWSHPGWKDVRNFLPQANLGFQSRSPGYSSLVSACPALPAL